MNTYSLNTYSRRRFIAALSAFLAIFGRVSATAAGITIQGDALKKVYRDHGVRLVILPGDQNGFDNISLLLSEIEPGGGPALHTHECEEVFVVYSGTVTYVLGDKQFTVTAPYVQHIPAHIPHTFINAGDTLLKKTAIFGSKFHTAKTVGPNPLWKEG